jgi:hypothetical protein
VGLALLVGLRERGAPVKYYGPKHRYSEETMARAVERYAAGESPTDIGRELGCNSRTVRDWAHCRGVVVRSMREAAAIRLQRAAAERERAAAAGETPKRSGPEPGKPTRRSPIQDDDEYSLAARQLLPVPEASDAVVSLTLVEVMGELRLIAKTHVAARSGEAEGQTIQHAWDAANADAWARGVLALFARASTPRTNLHREARHVR